MATVTLTIADNPLREMPGQVDYVVTFSAEPDLPTGSDGEPDIDALTPAQIAGVTFLTHIANLSLEAVFVDVPKGSDN